jgi:hypothetical protein
MACDKPNIYLQVRWGRDLAQLVWLEFSQTHLVSAAIFFLFNFESFQS